MTTAKSPPKIWLGQPLHVACLVLLLALIWLAWKYLDEPFPVTFWSAIAFPVVHQVFVWLAWRLEKTVESKNRGVKFSFFTLCLNLLKMKTCPSVFFDIKRFSLFEFLALSLRLAHRPE